MHEHAEPTPDVEPSEPRTAPAGPAAAPAPPALLRQAAGRAQSATARQIARRLQAAAGNRALARVVAPERMLQRRLLATGEVTTFMRMVEPAIGLQLDHDAASNEVTAVASTGTATSPHLASTLTRIMNDPAQNASVHFGRGQHRVAVGAFPTPHDLTGPQEQRIDLDDVEAIEAGAPGNGLAKFAHEILENYAAHGAVATPGVSQFPAAHRAAVAAESDVASDLAGPGARVADRDAPVAGSAQTVRVQDFTNYFLVFTLSPTSTAAGTDIAVSDARRAPRRVVNTYTIDSFATGSHALPAGAAAQVSATRADLLAHPQSTAHVFGFTDNVGAAAGNAALSQRRAATAAQAVLVGGGLGGGSFFVSGQGATGFVAPNTTDAERARNRRVVITVAEPGP